MLPRMCWVAAHHASFRFVENPNHVTMVKKQESSQPLSMNDTLRARPQPDPTLVVKTRPYKHLPQCLPMIMSVGHGATMWMTCMTASESPGVGWLCGDARGGTLH